MRLNTILMTAALMGLAALPAAAQSPQQRLGEEHAEWHRKHDADAYRNPAKYQREHQEEHSKLDQQYARMQRQNGYNPNRYGQYNPYGYGQQYPYGYPQQYPQNGGWYDQYGRWHPYQQQQSGWYDQYGRWHSNGSYQRRDRDDDDRRGQYQRQQGYYNPDYQYQRGDDDRGRGHNPKAEGRHDNGRHEGWNKNGKDRNDHDDRD